MRAMLGSLFAAILAAMALAQSPAGPQTTTPTDKASLGQIAAGGTIVAELSKSVDAKKARPGDRIEARLTMDVLSHGKVVIPRGAKIIGHVTDARARTKQAPESMVGVTFDRIVLKNGLEIPLKATIQAVGAPMQISAMGPEGISDASAGMPNPGTGMPDGMGGVARAGTPGYPPRPAGSAGAGGPMDNGGPNRNPAPPLGPTSQGVVGMKGISLSNTAQGSAISSSSENVHLSSGTQLVLRVTEQ